MNYTSKLSMRAAAVVLITLLTTSTEARQSIYDLPSEAEKAVTCVAAFSFARDSNDRERPLSDLEIEAYHYWQSELRTHIRDSEERDRLVSMKIAEYEEYYVTSEVHRIFARGDRAGCLTVYYDRKNAAR